jgi:hypothetical protein
MPERNFQKYRRRLKLLTKRLSNELAGRVSGQMFRRDRASPPCELR